MLCSGCPATSPADAALRVHLGPSHSDPRVKPRTVREYWGAPLSRKRQRSTHGPSAVARAQTQGRWPMRNGWTTFDDRGDGNGAGDRGTTPGGRKPRGYSEMGDLGQLFHPGRPRLLQLRVANVRIPSDQRRDARQDVCEQLHYVHGWRHGQPEFPQPAARREWRLRANGARVGAWTHSERPRRAHGFQRQSEVHGNTSGIS